MKHFYRLMALLGLVLWISCKQEKRYHDRMEREHPNDMPIAVQGILDFQKKLNAEFKNPETSPLFDRYRKDFVSLDFFPPDTSYIVKAKLIRTPEALPFLMPTTTGHTSEETVYGTVHFTLNGSQHQLEIYQNKELMRQDKYRDYLFLPFTDRTNGKQTYTGGRYLDLSVPLNDILVLDFNKAYNPYCAYDKKYSCPIVPSVNTLDTSVLAGVKAFEGY